MKILHVLDHSIPLHSGYTFRTAAILREQRRLGWETLHLTSPKQLDGSGAMEQTVDGLHFYRTPYTPPALPGLGEWRLIAALTKRLESLARTLHPDLIHAHSPVLNAIPALRVGRRLGIPTVYEVRAFWEDAAVDHGTSRENGLRYRLTRALETYALRRVDHVTTICQGLRQDILARGLPEQRVTVIPNAVDADAFRLGGAPEPELAAELGLTGATVLGFIGSFYAYEGLNLLLDALPRILAQAPQVRVLLVGGGVQADRLQGQAEQLGIADKVVFTGRVPHDQVQRYYDLVDLLVYPRLSMRLTELVTPLKPLEAMAQGRLLLASDVGGHRELIRDDETGWLFPAGDAQALAETALKILAQPEHWSRITRAGRRFVEEERTWRASVVRYQPIYQALTQGAIADAG
ncbi:MAG: TIGR04063 family PEP-CTERM/XrtA system glycosyltransferase [Lamprobacter sp.]|uniref:TIGR04063 family PEP-CTERM/XrtA system glycosyltransferase n=1 Tax=Lamprobacter sp. TaxID=3100796 RepID=UPI002B25A50D|nr:TIGR04063 family PEP-CTERM/XrtA system glycosyltransferase [Lamprobacter sp.]MEA3642015.1 TIGR04063 family PEP-CTERM/XrtA system glycosyltransferase [Lamprobacter sp.]